MVAKNPAVTNALKTDVLVVGAGASGVPTAIAAARNGAETVLLEDDAVPGGAPVDMYVAGPCGNPQVGIYREMLDRLNARHNFSLHPERRATWFLPSSYVRVIMEMFRELPKLKLMAGVRVVRALVSEGARNRVEGVTIQRAGGATQDILAQVVVDATGIAEVADMAGCPSMTLAPKLGVREARRIIGEHVITVNDLVTPMWPGDVVSVGRYGIDAWGDKDAAAKPIKIPERGYGIPYRALLVRGIHNLLVVGKAVSSTHLAQSAIRVQPIVSQMGQAAGTAAALAVADKTGLRSIDVAQLQHKLRNAGMLRPANTA